MLVLRKSTVSFPFEPSAVTEGEAWFVVVVSKFSSFVSLRASVVVVLVSFFAEVTVAFIERVINSVDASGSAKNPIS